MNFKKIGLTVMAFSFAIFTGSTTLQTSDGKDDEGGNETYREIDDFTESSAEFEALFNVTGEDIIENAMKYLGRPYRRGTAGPYTFDCSGFTSFVYGNNNISLSRSSKTQFTQGVKVSRDELREGDLVFFTSPGSGRGVGHVGIVTEVKPDGNFCFVHAARRGIKVDNFASSGYYNRRYLGARRILDY